MLALAVEQLVNVGWGVGWRRTHHLVAAAGLALALVLALIVQEPDRPANAKSASSGANRGLEALSNVFAEPATRWLFAAGGARYFGGLALVVFMPEFYRRTFPSYAAAFSVLNAVVLVLGGAMSAVAGGHLVDKLSQRDARFLVWVPAMGCVMGAFAAVATVTVPSFPASIFFFFLTILFAECWFGSFTNALQFLLPAQLVGSGVSLFLFVGSILGSVSPLLLGLADRRLGLVFGRMNDGALLADLLGGTIAIAYLVCAACFWMVSKHVSREVQVPSVS